MAALFVVMAIISAFLFGHEPEPLCPGHVHGAHRVLSLVPLIGLGGARSRFAPLAFAGHRRGRVRPGSAGAHGHGYAVIIAALGRAPGRRTPRAPGPSPARGLYLALATLCVRVARRGHLLHPAVSRSGPRGRPAGRLTLVRHALRRPRETFLLLVTGGVRNRRDRPWSRLRRGAVRPAGLIRAARQRGRGRRTVGVKRARRPRSRSSCLSGLAWPVFAGCVPRASTTRRSVRRSSRCSGGLPIVLTLVIGGVAHRVGCLVRRSVRARSHHHPADVAPHACFRALEFLAPGLARARHHPKPVGCRGSDRRGLRAAAAVA